MTTLYNADPGIPLYLDSKGRALEGLIYFGVPNLNPVTNPATVYWDAAGTQPAAQPIAVSAGRTVRTDGTPARVWISGDYSKVVLDPKGGQVDFQANQQTPAIPVTVTVDKFSGTGAPATYTLSVTPQSINDTSVFVGGVYQQKSSYTLVGNQLTITAASGVSNVEVNTAQNLDWSSIASTLTTAAATAQTSATAAAASRAQMLYIVQGSFAPGTPPTHRDDGSAIQAGDYASFTDNLFRRYNGATWVASDINTANLAASSGSSLVGWISGLFGSVARTLFGRLLGIPLDFEEFGAVGDGAADDTTALTNAIASGKRIVAQRGKTYKFSSTLTITDKQVDFSGASLVYTGAKNVFAMVVNATSGINGACDVRNFVLSSADTDTTNRTHGLCLGGGCGVLDGARIQGFTGISLALGSGAESYTGVTLPGAAQCYYFNVANITFASTSGWNLVVPALNNANHFRNISHFPFNGFNTAPTRAANCIDEVVIGGTGNLFDRHSLEASPSNSMVLFLATASGNQFPGITYAETNSSWATPPYPRFIAQAQSSGNKLWLRHVHNGVVPISDAGTANDIRVLPGFYINGSQVNPQAGGLSMVKNGRFENSATFWSDFSSGSVMSFGTGYLSGKSMRLDLTAGRPNVLQDLVATGGYSLAALKGQNITVAGFVRTDQAGVSIQLAGLSQNQVPNDGNWHWFTSTINVPTASSAINVQLISQASGLTGFVEWSDVTAVIGNEPQAVAPRDALTGSATYNPPSLATSTETTTTVTVNGAALGDFALASFSLDTQGIKINARVSAANTVTVTFRNDTGATLDLASGTLAVRVTKA